MPTPRTWIAAAYVRGRVYIVGGMTNTSEASTVNEEYTIATNSWATRRPLPESVMAYMVGVWRDSLVYVCGGIDKNYDATRTVQVYNPFTDSWAIAAPMLRLGDMGSAVIVGDTIYIPDAYDRGNGQIWDRMLKGAINPDTATQITWLWGPQPPEPMYLAGAVSLHDKVYAFSYHTDEGTREAVPAVVTASRLRVSALFRDGARIRYEIDRPCRATLTVYDQSGRVVRTLASGQVQAGSYAAAWDGRDQYGRPTGSGVYFCRLQAGEFTTARKMVKTE
ncbi:MAG: T9SS type A sorting domain-containing protein [candidate division WOR-3 bacterium]|nr:T9SS type A sorting domain-containing protein [candidate division WOR-3 bacterium]